MTSGLTFGGEAGDSYARQLQGLIGHYVDVLPLNTAPFPAEHGGAAPEFDLADGPWFTCRLDGVDYDEERHAIVAVLQPWDCEDDEPAGDAVRVDIFKALFYVP